MTLQRIVVGVDGSENSVAAVGWTAGLAAATGAEVVAVHALGLLDHLDSDEAVPSQPHREEIRQRFEGDWCASLARPDVRCRHLVRDGAPVNVLLAVADEEDADLIVVGSRGLGPVASAFRGSVSAHLVDHAGCPVLVARSPDATRMLLATDGTESSLRIPRLLAGWGTAFRGLPVEILSVATRDAFVTPWGAGYEADGALEPDLDVHERIAERVADEMMELGWHAAAVAVAGDPGREIVAAERDCGADLVVTGSRGLSTLRRLIAGSVAHDVLLHARSSVLVMRGQMPRRVLQRAAAFAAPA